VFSFNSFYFPPTPTMASNCFLFPQNRRFLAGGLFLLPALLPAAQLELGNLQQAYSGAAVSPIVTTVPSGLPVATVFQDLSASGSELVSETVFNNIPAVLPGSTISVAFSGQKISALGNYVRLSGTARNLESCDVVMVTWARASQFPALAAINPAGYYHDINLTLYSVSTLNKLTVLTSLKRSFLVPWRPDFQTNGQPWPYNGFAFKASFPFPSGTILTEQVMLMVDYNTESSGFEPLKVPGPYNVLNLGVGGISPSAGSDVNTDVVMRVSGEDWFYPNTGWSNMNGPVCTLRANNKITTTAPVAPGTYRVTALAGATGTDGTAQGLLTITPPSFNSWQSKQFTPEQIATGLAAPEADADGDGITNLAEYAMGTAPGTPTTDPPLVIDPAGLAITMVRPRWLTGVQYLPEETTDFSSWNPVPLQVLATGTKTETVRASATRKPESSQRSFLRIRFSP